MKQILASLSAVMLLIFISCNSNEPAKEETKTTNADTATAVKVGSLHFNPSPSP